MVGKRALELGFTSTVGIIHDGGGQLQPLAERRARGLPQMQRHGEEAATRGSTISRTTSRTARRTTGAAAPARATSTSAKTAWCTTARSSAAIRQAAAQYTTETSAANSSPRKAAPRVAPWPASTRFPTSTSGATRRPSKSSRAAWSNSSRTGPEPFACDTVSIHAPSDSRGHFGLEPIFLAHPACPAAARISGRSRARPRPRRPEPAPAAGDQLGDPEPARTACRSRRRAPLRAAGRRLRRALRGLPPEPHHQRSRCCCR